MTFQGAATTGRSTGPSLISSLKRGPSWKNCGKCGRGHSAPFNWCRMCRVAAALQTAQWRMGQFKMKLCQFCVEPQEKTGRNAWHPVAIRRGRYLTCERHREYCAAFSLHKYWAARQSDLDSNPNRKALADAAHARWDAVRVGKVRKSAARKAA